MEGRGGYDTCVKEREGEENGYAYGAREYGFLEDFNCEYHLIGGFGLIYGRKFFCGLKWERVYCWVGRWCFFFEWVGYILLDF